MSHHEYGWPYAQIPYVRLPGFPHSVYRHWIDVEKDGDRCKAPLFPGDDEACLCHRPPDRWWRGDPLAGLPAAEPVQ